MYNLIEKNIDKTNKSLLLSKGFIDNGILNQKYYTVFTNYRVLLECYLFHKLSLKSYDNELVNSNLGFIPIKKEDMDVYQKESTMGLKYIYLRNNLCIEKLSVEDINTLLEVNLSESKTINNKLVDLIERTYKDVINTNFDPDMKLMNCYGVDIDMFWIDSSELVFGVRYDEFVNNGLSDEEWEDNYFNQEIYLNNLIKEMSANCSNILGIKVNFIKYDEFTIKDNKSR